LVLAVPRGGVVVGDEIAKRLGCVLDVVISKKITPPDFPEYAIGAITSDGTLYTGPSWQNFSNVNNFEHEIKKKKIETKRRLVEFRGNDTYQLNKKTVILVDDGIATGSTIFALLKWLSKQKIKHLILAVPVISANTYEAMQQYVDNIFALEIPIEFSAVGQFYNSF
ncbi:phosphoribosyltransferase, partial [Streptococcus pseudopneumoniae]|uniref:phosphoribosyltransferase n=1 Tax=Streptococcus pseudopneumoniae TaxID=257758 RepID=UPI00110C2025